MELSFIHNFLINEGFILTKTKELNNNVSNYRKEQDASIFRIGFIIKEEDGKNLFLGFSIYINFLSIENILVPILAKNNLVGRESSPKDIYNSFFIDSNYKIPTIKKEIKSDKDIKQIEDDFYLFFNTDALPFFEKWKDLNVLYEYIKDKSIKTNPLAIKVKINDLRDNMDITRLVYITEKDTERLNKYLKAYQELKVCL